MIRIPIKEEDVIWAKEETKKFDEQKLYNKVESSNNYLGILSEMVLDRWWKHSSFEHIWVDFVKKGWDEPDFYVKGKSIDLKCTFGFDLLFEKAKFDYYIFSRVNEDLEALFVIGYISKEKMQKLIDSGKIETFESNKRKVYKITIDMLKPIEEFPNGL